MDARAEQTSKTRKSFATTVLLSVSFALAACDTIDFPRLGDANRLGENTTTIVERDVEAPEVFQTTEAGIWDGSTSQGGVWVSHPQSGSPERVIIRNPANDTFVIGSIFQGAASSSGPSMQVSQDAAGALRMAAGTPTVLNVTALRRQDGGDALDTNASAEEATGTAAGTDSLAPLGASAAPAETALAPAGASADESVASTAEPTVQPIASSLEKPYIQIGIFSVQANARRAADGLRSAGVIAQVIETSSSGKVFWRVTIGPASNEDERGALLEKARAQGFSDAFFTRN
ncbi:MAG: SPOR domain-containing protein [Pseudomonadota bacterium]